MGGATRDPRSPWSQSGSCTGHTSRAWAWASVSVSLETPRPCPPLGLPLHLTGQACGLRAPSSSSSGWPQLRRTQWADALIVPIERTRTLRNRKGRRLLSLMAMRVQPGSGPACNRTVLNVQAPVTTLMIGQGLHLAIRD